MDQKDKKLALLPLTPLELEYKSFFCVNPDVYFYDKKGDLYKDWSEFRTAYKKNAGKNLSIPSKAPSLFGYILQENRFF